MKDSTQVELDDISYVGSKIIDTDYPSGFDIQTLDEKIFKITDDNFDILVRSSKIENGRLVGPFRWQAYKNKWLFLPDGLLDQTDLSIGDIVEPVVSKYYRHASKMVYLGVKDLLDYDSKITKSVRKQLHIFVSIDQDFQNQIFYLQNINSAFFKKGCDKKLAKEFEDKLNTNELNNVMDMYERSRRSFYVDSFKQTKIKPVLVQIPDPHSPNQVFRHDMRIVVKINDIFYYVRYGDLQGRPFALRGRILKNIDVCTDPSVIVDLNKDFRSKKYMEENEVDIAVQSSYEYYAIVYELYQNGVLLGRK